MQIDTEQKHSLSKLHSVNEMVIKPSKKDEMDLHPQKAVPQAGRKRLESNRACLGRLSPLKLKILLKIQATSSYISFGQNWVQCPPEWTLEKP